jgi:hypothetical protein
MKLYHWPHNHNTPLLRHSAGICHNMDSATTIVNFKMDGHKWYIINNLGCTSTILPRSVSVDIIQLRAILLHFMLIFPTVCHVHGHFHLQTASCSTDLTQWFLYRSLRYALNRGDPSAKFVWTVWTWTRKVLCRIWGFHSGGFEEYLLLGYDAV